MGTTWDAAWRTGTTSPPLELPEKRGLVSMLLKSPSVGEGLTVEQVAVAESNVEKTSGQVDVSTEGKVGVIALNRPEAINALSAGMIADIQAALDRFADDPAIRAVLFEGRGPEGFCAGGDVRAVRSAVLEGRRDEAEAYFANEYWMNRPVATPPSRWWRLRTASSWAAASA